MDPQSCASIMMITDSIAFFLMDETRFQVLDIAVESFTYVQQLLDDPLALQVVPHHGGSYTVDGATRKLGRFVIRAREINQASEIISAITNLKGILPFILL